MTDSDELVERVWCALKERCCVDPDNASRIVMLGRDDLAAALSATPLAQMREPEWFYLAGDMSSDRCRFSPSEVIDEDWLYENRGVGTHVVQIECAAPCPDIWCVVHFFTDAEKDARQSDDDYEIREFATEAAARAALTGEAP